MIVHRLSSRIYPAIAQPRTWLLVVMLAVVFLQSIAAAASTASLPSRAAAPQLGQSSNGSHIFLGYAPLDTCSGAQVPCSPLA